MCICTPYAVIIYLATAAAAVVAVVTAAAAKYKDQNDYPKTVVISKTSEASHILLHLLSEINKY